MPWEYSSGYFNLARGATHNAAQTAALTASLVPGSASPLQNAKTLRAARSMQSTRQKETPRGQGSAPAVTAKRVFHEMARARIVFELPAIRWAFVQRLPINPPSASKSSADR
jgi:hypothetical protein